MDQAEERICELRDRNFEITQSEGNKEKRMKRCEEWLRELPDTIKRNNSWITAVPERGDREVVAESLFKEKMAENFLNLGWDLDIQDPKAHKSPTQV